MRSSTTIIAALATMLATAPAVAADGQYGGSLKTMLTQAAAGNCPADLMGEKLLAACREQIGAMRPALAAAGAVAKVDFVKAEGDGAERVETYNVHFAKGSTSVWNIGKFQGGKFQAAWSNE